MDESLLVGFFDHYAFNADVYHVKKFVEKGLKTPAYPDLLK
jgi:hypothetical protein